MVPLKVASPATTARVWERLARGGAEAAWEAIADVARHTPVLTSRSLSEACGGRLLLKAENLQRTGTFKLRGALHKLARLGAQAERGVVAGSAGNHAQSLAYAARVRGVRCEEYMPEEAAVGKVAAVEGFGGAVHLSGRSVDDCVALARERAAQTGPTFVNPFDDPTSCSGRRRSASSCSRTCPTSQGSSSRSGAGPHQRRAGAVGRHLVGSYISEPRSARTAPAEARLSSPGWPLMYQ